MLKILIKFMINSDGESPGQLVERLRDIGGVPMAGDYDVGIPLSDEDRLFPKIDEIHQALKGSGVLYSLYTGGDEPEQKDEGISNVLQKDGGDQKLLEIRKNMYRSKLFRWREMGVDTAHLEELLETDIDKFREESKNFLREHLDKNRVIEDVDSRDLKKIDEKVYERVDDAGVSIGEICSACTLGENDSVLSLGRLMSAGKVVCITREGNEFYTRAPPHEPEKVEGGQPTAGAEGEAQQRVLEAVLAKGSTFRQICDKSGLPEEQVLNALSELLEKSLLKTGKRGKSTIYLKQKK